MNQTKGMRVNVWNGDKSEHLGFGTYVDDIPAYLILSENLNQW